MCCDQEKCQKCTEPRDPAECSPEQIKQCHGDEEGHPCADK